MNIRVLTRFFVFAALAIFPSSDQAQQPLQVLHRHVLPVVSNGQAALAGPLPQTQWQNLSILLPLRNQSELTSLLNRLYDPSSPDYRQFLSVDQFTQQFGPTAEDYQAVVDFAQANGFTVTDRSANRLLVPMSGSVENIEKAFNVRMNNYQHPTENRTFFSPDREPSLNLSVPVAHIAGLNDFSIPRSALAQAPTAKAIPDVTGSAPGGGTYLASDMRAAYYGGTALTGTGQCVGLFELGGYYLSDVNLYFSNSGQSNSVPINNVLIDGASPDAYDNNDQEQALDIEQAIGMAPGLDQVRVYIQNFGPGSVVDAFNAMATENICKQLSLSYLLGNEDLSTTFDSVFQEFAAQGQSLFVASGDWGAFPTSENQSTFFAYPADDVWVTAVGGTDLLTNGAGGPWSSETAWDGSGGGPSPYGISIPSWQGGLNGVNGTSTTLRNAPDVAMDANSDTDVCYSAFCGQTGGTSAATPRWAAFMALVNQQAVANGAAPKGGLGFINPAIYAIGEGSNYDSNFHDITSGNNGCCGQSLFYNAVTGYDLVTGWGTPNGQNLIDALAGDPANGFTLTNSALTANLSINQGASGTATITVNDRGGFTGSVNLSVTSGLPSGVTASWGANPTTGSSVLTLSVAGNATPGTVYVTVTGTSGALIATTTFALTIVAPSFTLSLAQPNIVTIWVGSPASNAILVNDQDGWSSNVNLAVTAGLPSGMTATFSPSSTATTSTLTLSTTSFPVTATTYYLTITGTSGALSATTFLNVVVEPIFFAISGSPGNLTVSQGSSGTSTLTLTPYYGATGSVTLSASLIPNGVTASFSPNPTTGSSTLTLSVSSTATTGTFWVNIGGVGSQPGVIATVFNLALTVPVAAPTTTTTAASAITSTTASLNATVNPNGADTHAWFLYGTSSTMAGASTTTSVDLGSGTSSTPATASLTGLNPSTTYYFEVVAQNSVNTTDGTVLSFTTPAAPVPSFAIAGTSVTVAPGATTANTSTITVMPSGGFTGNVALTATITSSPAGAQYPPTLSFGSTTPVNITGSSSGTAILTVSTTAASIASLANPMHHGFPWYTEGGAALACILLFGIPARRSRWRTMLGMLALLITFTGGVLACSSVSVGSSNPGTTAGAYTITLTGTSGTTTATNTVALNVQ